MQSLYVAGIMTKCPILSKMSAQVTLNMQHSHMAGNLHKRRYQAVIRKVINAVLIYFLDYNFTKCLLKGAGCI